MPISVTATLGLVFLGLSLVSTYLMFRFWGYPYDKEKRKSSCPQWKMNIHRGIGYVYVAVYVVMMTQMVPRLWEYQVEFPARTVAHVMLGFTIGVLLVLKISILRWFRHFEEWMPAIGVSLLLCTVLLSGLSLPFVFKQAIGSDDAFTAQNQARVAKLLTGAGLAEGTDLVALSSEKSLRYGRRVLLDECTFCHDLKTAIARPRTPEDWVRTVERMVDKPSVGPRIDPDEARAVAAYLVAITPDLQQSAKAKRAADQDTEESVEAAREIQADELVADAGPAGEAAPVPDAGPAAASPKAEPTAASSKATAQPPAKPRPKRRRPKLDLAMAHAVYEKECSKCHGLDDVTESPPRSSGEVRELIRRMVEDNGMTASRKELRLIRFYLQRTFVQKKR